MPQLRFAQKGIAAAILAGGKSTRMGQHKALLPFQGKPLLVHLLERLATDVQLLLVAGSPEPQLYRGLRVPVINDEFDSVGPLGGIASALRYVRKQQQLQQDPARRTRFERTKANQKLLTPKTDIAYLLVLPCDGIHLPRLFVSRMVRALERRDADLVYASDAQREQHLYCLLKVELLDSLEQYLAQGGRKVIDWFHLQHYAVEDFSADGFTFSNLNTADDWQAFLSHTV